ncbi:hypothetical protein PG994_003361 [Apiospora phragmitis]|uniref:Protein kinase domain-containing protein n=1 Tax=Apiospora phragmitis TaxID=2905665 RepID=A0ABR1VXZ4_9PEZI
MGTAPASLMDLRIYEKSEVFSEEGNDLEFYCTKVVFKGVNDQFFYTTTRDRLTPDYVVDPSNLELVPIPMDNIWPPSDGFTRAPEPVPDNCYVKQPSLLRYGDSEASLALSASMVTEIRACEILKDRPHPNIASYLGCLIEDGKVRGLCFVKYTMTLTHRLRMPKPLDLHYCLQGIKEGVKHLHQQGLIHNDLNPANIMFDEDDNPIIIDFDSCKREGEELGLKGGTEGWTLHASQIAAPENDLYALERIEEHLAQFR